MISYVMLVLIILFVLGIFYFVPVGLWVQSVVSLGVGNITIIDLIRMRLRKIPPRLVVDGIINMHKAGLEHISTSMMETHYLAGGNVANISFSMIAANKANIPLNFETATSIDLAGRDIKTAVETSVYPKVIDAPAAGTLAAVAKDGIEVKARARVPFGPIYPVLWEVPLMKRLLPELEKELSVQSDRPNPTKRYWKIQTQFQSLYWKKAWTQVLLLKS